LIRVDGKLVSSSSSEEKPLKKISDDTPKTVESHVVKPEIDMKKAEVQFQENPQRDAPMQKLEIHSKNVQSFIEPVAKASINVRTLGLRSTVSQAAPEAPKRIMISDLAQHEWSSTDKVKVILVGLVDGENLSQMVLCDHKFENEFFSISDKVQNYCSDKKSSGYVPE
jgi:hypothetical protein